MPRKTLLPPGQTTPAPHVIHPTAVYDLAQARAALGLAKGTLSREIPLKRLRVSERAGKKWVLGAWLLAWIEEGDRRRLTPDSNGHAD
jgi:hypothetical protein